MYQILIKNGTVTDPASGLRGVYDVAVEDRKISSIAEDIDSPVDPLGRC